MKIFKFKNFSQFSELLHGFSTKDYGGMKIGWPDAEKNLKKFSDDLGIDIKNIIRGFPAFTDQVKIVSQKDRGKYFRSIDGLVSKDYDTYLMFTFADCISIFIYDPVQKICGVAHAGWKNTLKNIAGKLVKSMQRLGSDQKDLIAGLGPAIGPDHFEISKEIFEKFAKFSAAQIIKNNKFFVDLWETNKIQLKKAGINPKNIEISGECTFCLKEKYFSYRRDFYNQSKFPTMAAVIGIKK